MKKRDKSLTMSNTTDENQRNSPFDSFLIDEPTPRTNHRLNLTNDLSITKCVACHDDLRKSTSKLLTCLHSICSKCFETHRDDSALIFTCPTCEHKSRFENICENLYANETSEMNGSSKHCSNCEEGNVADWFCDNCADWLCLQCKNAHARVRITKDHTVTQKNATQTRQMRGENINEKLVCHIHKDDLARNFCQDCQKLTCDECQISQHKNHRYLFIDEAIVHQKNQLQTLVTKVRDVRLMLNKIHQTRHQQLSDIDQIERRVVDDIKLFALNLIAEISRTCKTFIDETNETCRQARRQISEKNLRFEQYLHNIDYSLDFVNEALTSGSKFALLTSNRLMSKRLDHLLHQNALWSKSITPFQLTFSPIDSKTTRSNIANLGVLIQNGKKKFVHNSTVVQNTKLDDNGQPAILLDTSDDYCAVCRCGGELVCCDECPRVYHVECHVPSLNEVSMTDKWKCGCCSEIDETTTNSLKRKHDDLDENSSSSSSTTTTSHKLTSIEKQIAEKLILQMYIHPQSVPFHHPVPADCVSYHKIITRPIDLGTIREKFNSYANLNEFIADVRLMFNNCSTFNRPESEIGKSGRALNKVFDELLEKYCSTHQIPLPDRSNKRKKTSVQLTDHVS